MNDEHSGEDDFTEIPAPVAPPPPYLQCCRLSPLLSWLLALAQ